MIAIALYIAGCVLSLVSYSSIEPVFACVATILCFFVINTLFNPNRTEEFVAFSTVFSICWFWAGIAAYYSSFFDDIGQNYLDANYFFERVTYEKTSNLSQLSELLFSENGFGILLWELVYSFFSFIGFQKAKYIGILLNITLVSATAIIGIRIVKSIYGNDRQRIDRFIRLFSLCGTFWLFAAIHLRDAAVLFFVTLFISFWVHFLKNPGLLKACLLLAISLSSVVLFGSLRNEFTYFPIALLFACGAGSLLGGKNMETNLKLFFIALFTSLIGSLYLYLNTSSGIIDILSVGRDTYDNISENQSSYDSLGERFIIKQILPLRLFLGSFYLYLYPIPVWVGFQLDSAYNLFKSFNAIYMYFLTPLFALAIWKSRRAVDIRPQLYFLIFTTLGFTLAIAYTSLETRHIGVFLIPMIVVSLVPDLNDLGTYRTYKKITFLYISSISVLHFAWSILKS